MHSSSRSIPRQSRSPSPCNYYDYSVSANKKSFLSIFLFLSIISITVSLKVPKLIIVFILCAVYTVKCYQDIENDALNEAIRMKKKLTFQQIKTAFRKPPSPEFDQRVRIKVLQLLNKDAFKDSK